MTTREYQGILDHYLDIEARNRSNLFLEKYWLREEEKLDFWELKKDEIFSPNSKDLPSLMFQQEFNLIAYKGGILFTEDEFCALQKCMRIAGDTFFVLIENRYKRNSEGDFPHLQLKFPVEITWTELNNGDEDYPDISYETLYIMNKHFFVFGNSGKWGKYAAGDFGNTPIDIIGFKSEMESIFRINFKQSRKEQQEVLEWVPSVYKDLIYGG